MGFFSDLWNKITGGSPSSATTAQTANASEEAPMNAATTQTAMDTATETPAEAGVTPTEQAPTSENLGVSEPQEGASSESSPNAPATEQPTPEEAKEQLQTDISGTKEPRNGEMPNVSEEAKTQ